MKTATQIMASLLLTSIMMAPPAVATSCTLTACAHADADVSVSATSIDYDAYGDHWGLGLITGQLVGVAATPGISLTDVCAGTGSAGCSTSAGSHGWPADILYYGCLQVTATTHDTVPGLITAVDTDESGNC